MSRRHPLPSRREQYEDEHRRSAARKGDRIAAKPPTLAQLHRWLVEGYKLEAPGRLHDRDIADDGAPDHTSEAKSYIGFAQRTEPNDWKAVACRTDDDGYFLTPMRAAISRVGDPDRRAFLGALACNLLTPLDVTRAFAIPDWVAVDVMGRSLDMIWSLYSERVIPRQGKSSAQLDAEAAA